MNCGERGFHERYCTYTRYLARENIRDEKRRFSKNNYIIIHQFTPVTTPIHQFTPVTTPIHIRHHTHVQPSPHPYTSVITLSHSSSRKSVPWSCRSFQPMCLLSVPWSCRSSQCVCCQYLGHVVPANVSVDVVLV